METGKTLSKNEIVDANAHRLRRALAEEPRYPEVRAIFGPIKLMTSFSHAIPDMRSMHVWGNIILRELADGAGLAEKEVANIAYDNANPTIKCAERGVMPNYPGDHRLGIGEFPTVLDAEIPISQQKLTRSINFKQMKLVTLKAFGSSAAEVEGRVDKVLELMQPLQRDHAVSKPAVPAIMDVRMRIMALLGLKHLPEVTFSSLNKRMVDSLMVLDKTYGKPFYKMPLGDFQEVGFLKGITERGERKPVQVSLEGDSKGREIPVFSYGNNGSTMVIKGDTVYDALLNGTVIPTVPTIILALTAGPQIAHMGGQDWKRYAPRYMPVLAEWLGISGEAAGSLILCTEGRKPYSVAYTDREGQEKVSAHFSMSYVTLGPDGIREALRRDERIQGRYGTAYGALRRD